MKRTDARAQRVAVRRADGEWENAYMGMGTRHDRTRATRASMPMFLNRDECTAIYVGNGFGRRIVDSVTDDMTRAGFEIKDAGNARGVEEIMADCQDLEVLPRLREAYRWSRAYGGGVIVLGINDGGELTDPLDMNRAEGLEFMRVYDRHSAVVVEWEIDPDTTQFGRPRLYMISPVFFGGTAYFVHASRVIRIDGDPIPDYWRGRNAWWGASIFQRCIEQLKNLGMSHWLALEMLSRAQQPVHKIPGLTQNIRDKWGEDLVKKRVNLLDMTRNVVNTVVIDAAEDFKIEAPGISTGATQVIDIVGRALSAVTGIPEVILFGRAPGGLQASGDADLENYYAMVKGLQQTRFMDPLNFILKLLFRARGVKNPQYTIEFLPLWLPSEKDQASANQSQSQADMNYVNGQVIAPSEMRDTLRKEGRYVLTDDDVVPTAEKPVAPPNPPFPHLGQPGGAAGGGKPDVTGADEHGT
ncbi:MAG: DUF1073 domain-containing protein [Paraburkholderia sp.]|nr:DUF1073 domain-containing protein [Paraburkholderia sp.]